MSIWIVAADASRVRIFEARNGGASLVEVEDLVQPSSRLHERELVSDRPGTGRGRPAGGGVGHSVGHEHDAAHEEHDRFAREVAGVLERARQKGRFGRLHLLSAPRFLGLLRTHMDGETLKQVVSELDVSVTGETPAQIRARLPAHL